MSDVRVKYIGAVSRFSEIGITGQQQVWRSGQAGFVPDRHAAALVGSGLFEFADPQKTQVPLTQRTGITGAAKWFGSCVNNYTAGQPTVNGSSYRATYGLTVVAEAPFYAIQLVYVNNVNNALSGMKALVGVTETIDTSVSGSRCKPVINGTTYGQLAPAGSVNGFRPVTWGGAATLSVPASVTSTQIVASDVIPAESVARADVPGALPAAVVRLDHDPSTGGNFPFMTVPVSMRTPNAANRGRVIQAFNIGFDGVANPNQNVNLATDMHQMFVIFHYAVPSLTVAVAGDSISQNDSLVADKFPSWGWRGCADASSPKRPVNYVNLGCSSKGSPEFWMRTQELVAAGVVPDVLVIAPASVNDGYTQANLARTFSDHKARAMEILRFARAKGIPHVCFIPLMPSNALNSVQDGYRKDYNAFLREIPGVQVLNFNALGDGATPERWVPGLNYNSDGIHPNELAIETVMAPALTSYLLSLP